ncbi:MAG: hypothetical protein DRI88_05390 [Bacteroidetes bacterium]|nr:MAG: hypothetical protein DRI72_09990 [Bacteroidota bacterium]RLD47750.1 MAG: hypothetical protein DRI88_05390 [Bacteroidota bacterium]RLD87805.1 MAG: hypothetical protein DRJ02_05440 [Bacteroidota bacterium]
MKNLIYLVAISMFLFSSCCGGGSDAKSDKESAADETIITEEVVETNNGEEVEIKETEEITSCDEFLDRYEAWVKEYLDLLETFKNNPTDPDLSQKYMNVSQEAATWTQQWFQFVDCSKDEKYEKRYDEISEMVDKKLEELDMK